MAILLSFLVALAVNAAFFGIAATRKTGVVTSFDPALLEAEANALRRLAKAVPLALSGPGASDALCARLGARRPDGDLVAAANEIAAAR